MLASTLEHYLLRLDYLTLLLMFFSSLQKPLFSFKIQHQCNDAIGMKTAAERQLELACSEIRKAEDRQAQIRESHKTEMAKTSAHLQGQLSKLNAEIQSGREEIKEIERRNRIHITDLERKLAQSEQMNHSLQEYVNYLKTMSEQLTFK